MTSLPLVGDRLPPSVLRWTEKHSLGAVAVPSGCLIGAAVRHWRHMAIDGGVS